LDRCDCFTFDPDLPADFPRYNTADYTGAAAINGFGIDRGHLARSFDRTTGSLDNATTFYFSNIVPQASDLNQQPWAALEDSLGNLARFHGKEVYIIAGVAGNRGTVKNEGKITIPAYTWKVAIVMPEGQGLANVTSYKDVDVFAVIMPNKSFKEGLVNDWKVYQTTVDKVEELSGYNLLDKLDDQTEILVESGDRPPKAVWGGETSGVEGSGVDFDAAGSSDPDAEDALTYSWNFGDNSTGSGAHPTHVFADNGVYNVVLTVTDKAGATDVTSNFVSVSNANPSVVLATAPTIVSGGTYSLSGGFGDLGQLDGPWSYTINWGDGSQSGTALTQGAITGSHTYSTAGSYTVILTVRDKDGGMGSATATLRVARIATGLGVNPAQINTKNNGNGQVIVTVFGSSSFAGDMIDIGSVRIGGVQPDLRGNGDSKSSIEDANGDGIADLIVHFERSALVSGGALTAGTKELVLQANLTDGRQIEARGALNMATRE
jgi:PKD repeat protein